MSTATYTRVSEFTPAEIRNEARSAANIDASQRYFKGGKLTHVTWILRVHEGGASLSVSYAFTPKGGERAVHYTSIAL
jgi:hypothetical protein